MARAEASFCEMLFAFEVCPKEPRRYGIAIAKIATKESQTKIVQIELFTPLPFHLPAHYINIMAFHNIKSFIAAAAANN